MSSDCFEVITFAYSVIQIISMTAFFKANHITPEFHISRSCIKQRQSITLWSVRHGALAVLVAISVFTSLEEKSRESVDLSKIRRAITRRSFLQF